MTPSAFATLFGIGRWPFAPGTLASFVALVLALGLVSAGGWPLLLASTVALTALGLWAGDAYVTQTGKEDPKEVVIDEAAGMWLALVAAPVDPYAYALAFLAFRALDIVKPWPISVLDRMKGGFGVMADDIAAGFAAGALVAVSAALGLVS